MNHSYNTLTSTPGISPWSVMAISSSSDKYCSSSCSVSARLSLAQVGPWKLLWYVSPGKLRKSFSRASDWSSSNWLLLIFPLKIRGDFVEPTAELGWLQVGGGRNGNFPSCRLVSEVDEDDWYKLVQNTEERENAFLAWCRWETGDTGLFDSDLKLYLGGLTEEAPMKVGEPRDSVRMKGEGRGYEHSAANKLLPSDPILKKSCTGVQYGCRTPLEGSPCVADMIPCWFIMIDGNLTFINCSKSERINAGFD